MTQVKKKISSERSDSASTQKNQHSLKKTAFTSDIKNSKNSGTEVDSFGLSAKDFEMSHDIETHGLKINLPENLAPGENVTRIKLVTSSGQEILMSAEDAKNFIDKASDDIDKIVIEQVRQSGADRYSLHLTQPKSIPGTTEKIPHLSVVKSQEVLTQKPLNDDERVNLLQQMEEMVNRKVIKQKPQIKHHAIETNVSMDNSKSSLPVVDSGETDYVYRQRTFIRKRIKKGSDYFYKAENHLDLYNIGQSYMNDFKQGMKNFAFACDDQREAKEKTIFGLCSFFNYHTEATVTIVTKSVDQSFYHNYVPEMQTTRKRIESENISFSVYECDEFQIIEFDELVRISTLLRTMHVEDFIQEIIKESDIVFWDLPSFDAMAKNREVYFPTLRSINNVSLLVGEGSTHFDFITRAKDYYKKYNIKIKGALINKEIKK